MQINISELKKNEYAELMKVIPITALREIAVSENKLAKKYIIGFRPSNAPVSQLLNLYYQEIHANNKIVEDKLVGLLNDYSEKIQLDEWVIKISKINTIKDYIRFGSEYAKSGIALKMSIICKLLNMNIESEKLEAIQDCVDEFNTYINSENETKNSMHEKSNEDQKIIDKLIKEKDVANQKKDSIAKELEKLKDSFSKDLKSLKTELDQYREKCFLSEKEVMDYSTLLDERSIQIEELKRIQIQLEESLRLLKEEKEKKEEEIQETRLQLKEMEENNRVLGEEKDLEYAKTLNRLVEDTISDLKVDYSLELKQIVDIVETIEGDHDIVNVWKQLSALNLDKLVDVEVAMSNDLVNMDILDMCDDIENNILVKYVILKAIKSLLFEFLSEKEKSSTIAGKLKVMKDN